MYPISVIISNFNGAKYLPRLIETLQNQTGVVVEIIVVDRNSTDDSDAILNRYSKVKIVKHPPETGLVSGYTAGLPFAKHQQIFFCNEDMWFDPHCLQECSDLLMSADKIGAVMPIQWTYDGTAIVNAGIWYQRCFWSRADPVLTRDARWHVLERPARLSFTNAGACLFRKQALEEAGGWDTTFFLDCEDVDLGIRLWQHGWESWVAPAAILGHAVGASNQKNLPATGSTVNRKRYVHAFSNFLMIGLKYFSPLAIPRTFMAFFDVLLRDLVKGRFDNLYLDMKVLALTMKRIREWVPFRKSNRTLNRAKPGEQFFFEPVFQYNAILGNKSTRSHVDPIG